MSGDETDPAADTALFRAFVDGDEHEAPAEPRPRHGNTIKALVGLILLIALLYLGLRLVFG